jgi:hypothetical protein
MNSIAMFMYRAVRLMTRDLSSLTPFPKLNAAEKSSRLKTWKIIKMYCIAMLKLARLRLGKIMGSAK